MARSQFYDSVQDSSGNFVTTSEVTVYLYGTTTKATVYENESGSTQKANPFTPTDGFIKFWAEPGSYDVLIADTANPAVFTTRTIRFDSIPAVSGVISQTINDGAVTNNDLESSSVLDKAGINSTAVKRRGVCEVLTEETIASSSSNVLAPTPDRIQNLVLPTDGLIFIVFRCLIKSNNAATVISAVPYLSSNRIAIPTDGTYPTDMTPNTNSTYWSILQTHSGGFSIAPTINTFGDSSFDNIATGEVLGLRDAYPTPEVNRGGVLVVEAAAGTYDVSIKYTTSTNSGAVKQRKLWVWTQGF